MSLSETPLSSQPLCLEDRPIKPLPSDRLERIEAWGMNTSVLAYVFRPSTLEGVREVFALARQHGRKVCLRGMGRSYGDAALLAENICLDLTRMNRILDWNPHTGRITVEPGATIGDIWRYAIEDGWWPPVVSGTMYVSLGGGAAMNIHGKNNWKVGPIGEHILEFDLLLPTGEIVTCSPERNSELFYAAIGGFGMLGCFTRLTLQLKRIYTGLLEVDAFSAQNFEDIVEQFERRMDSYDYLVGWIDCFATGRQLGRGLVHAARYLAPGEDPVPAQTLRVEHQELPDTLMGFIPKSIMWRLMRPFANNLGMRFVNWAKFTAGNTIGNHKRVRQSHAAFAFLLDYVPNWKWAYKPGCLIQYQSFIPAEQAARCFSAQLTLCQQTGIVPWLGVFKRHRRDRFLMTHSVDGYSLALDIPVYPHTRERVWALAKQLNRLVLEAGGRFYFAKDSTLDPHTARAYLGEETIARFAKLKKECDPEGLLQSALSQRLFPTLYE